MFIMVFNTHSETSSYFYKDAGSRVYPMLTEYPKKRKVHVCLAYGHYMYRHYTRMHGWAGH